MKIAAITPTYRYGGLDVNYASLMSQTLKPDVWIIADDLYPQRHRAVVELLHWTEDAPFEIRHFRPRDKPDGYFSDLAHIYNEMLGIASEEGCDLAISMQDYLWAPQEGIQSFAQPYLGDLDETCLLTGSCSLSYDPRPESVVAPEGMWTVYGEPYDGGKPREIWWRDVRLDLHDPSAGIARCDPVQWELNWAAIPVALYDAGARFPEHYGQGIAHENIAFAVQAILDHGASTWIDVSNHAIGLPHKHYWPEQEEEGLPHAMENMKMFHEEYDGKMGLL